MKLGPVTKTDKKNTARLKKLTMALCCKIVTSLSFFRIYGFWMDSGHMAYKIYIFINSDLLCYKTLKQKEKISNTALILLL